MRAIISPIIRCAIPLMGSPIPYRIELIDEDNKDNAPQVIGTIKGDIIKIDMYMRIKSFDLVEELVKEKFPNTRFVYEFVERSQLGG